MVFPLTGEWFYAERGIGAFKNGQRIQMPETKISLREAWVDMNQFGDAALESPLFSTLRERLRSSQGARLVTSLVPHSGIAMRIIDSDKQIAAAIHDNNATKVKQAPWDIAAPQCIVEVAGGVFLNSKGQRTDPFVPDLTVVAQTESLAHEILSLRNE